VSVPKSLACAFDAFCYYFAASLSFDRYECSNGMHSTSICLTVAAAIDLTSAIAMQQPLAITQLGGTVNLYYFKKSCFPQLLIRNDICDYSGSGA
jgi:hypothetical protein